MSSIQFPDHALIKTLTNKYLSTSISSMSMSEVTDLINHLREHNNQLQNRITKLESSQTKVV